MESLESCFLPTSSDLFPGSGNRFRFSGTEPALPAVGMEPTTLGHRGQVENWNEGGGSVIILPHLLLLLTFPVKIHSSYQVNTFLTFLP
jgi:hypothetical protein